jgi:hypothetical protein
MRKSKSGFAGVGRGGHTCGYSARDGSGRVALLPLAEFGQRRCEQAVRVVHEAENPVGLRRQTGLSARLSKVDQAVLASPKSQLPASAG